MIELLSLLNLIGAYIMLIFFIAWGPSLFIFYIIISRRPDKYHPRHIRYHRNAP